MNEPYEQVDFSSADEMGLDLVQYEYGEGLTNNFFDLQTREEKNDWQKNKFTFQVMKSGKK